MLFFHNVSTPRLVNHIPAIVRRDCRRRGRGLVTGSQFLAIGIIDVCGRLARTVSNICWQIKISPFHVYLFYISIIMKSMTRDLLPQTPVPPTTVEYFLFFTFYIYISFPFNDILIIINIITFYIILFKKMIIQRWQRNVYLICTWFYINRNWSKTNDTIRLALYGMDRSF